MQFKFTVQSKIGKPLNEVFDGIYKANKLSEYFTHKADSDLVEGKTVAWVFADDPENAITIPVQVLKTVPNKLIQFSWAASEGIYDAKTGEYPQPGGYDTTVEITFEALSANQTLVKITEGKWRETDAGLQGSYQNCQGWMQMLCCLKAFLENGINLRKGAL